MIERATVGGNRAGQGIVRSVGIHRVGLGRLIQAVDVLHDRLRRRVLAFRASLAVRDRYRQGAACHAVEPGRFVGVDAHDDGSTLELFRTVAFKARPCASAGNQ